MPNVFAAVVCSCVTTKVGLQTEDYFDQNKNTMNIGFSPTLSGAQTHESTSVASLGGTALGGTNPGLRVCPSSAGLL